MPLFDDDQVQDLAYCTLLGRAELQLYTFLLMHPTEYLHVPPTETGLFFCYYFLALFTPWSSLFLLHFISL